MNNAGFGVRGPIAEGDLADELGMPALNVVALTHLTRLLLTPMLQRGEGKILNVGKARP